MMIRSALLLGLFAVTTLPAQRTVVDYPDSSLVNPPELLFPFYTLGSGGVVRYQTMCPSSFAGLPTTPQIVTAVGVQIAGQEVYDRFEVRFGSSTIQTLTACFAQNLPDDTLQYDLSGEVLPGGLQNGQPVNEWVEFPLDKPFIWTPGESLVFDLISSAAAPGAWCSTGVAAHPRVYEAPYVQAGCGSLTPDSGLKLRIVFEPVGSFPVYGQGCAGAGGFDPQITGSGTPTPGQRVFADLSNSLGSAPTGLILGLSRLDSPALGRLPFDVGGGCSLLNSGEFSLPAAAPGAGPGQGSFSYPIPIPNDPAVTGTVIYAQFTQLDQASGAFVPVTTSNGLIFLVQ